MCRMGTMPVAGPVQTSSTDDVPAASDAVADDAQNMAESSPTEILGLAFNASASPSMSRDEKAVPSASFTTARMFAWVRSTPDGVLLVASLPESLLLLVDVEAE